MNKKNTTKVLFALTIICLLSPFVSTVSYAQTTLGPTTLNYSGWVQCDGVVPKDANGNPIEQDRDRVCNFANLILMVKYLINWAFGISIPVMVGLLAYAGFKYMTGQKGEIDQAKKIMWSAVKGFVIALLAWFIVTTILKLVLNSDFLKVTDTLIGK